MSSWEFSIASTAHLEDPDPERSEGEGDEALRLRSVPFEAP